MSEDKPIWRSKKAICYLVTLLLSVVCAAFGKDELGLRLAEGVIFGLPILLGAQGAVDFARFKRN